MKKAIKILISLVVIAVSASSGFMLKQLQVSQIKQDGTHVVSEHIIDMTQVISIEKSDDGVYIQFTDGTGYWWEL